MSAPSPTDEAKITGDAYDAVPYPSHAFARTRPDRLATLGRLFGVATAAPDHARVLELGCASGGNLLPLAAAAPAGTYLGIDASPRQVGLGRRLITEHGLTNTRLEVHDLTTWEPEPGAWDYVICHGVYAWVGPAVRAGILRIVRQALAPGGVGCISYNTAPGWRLLGGVRDALQTLDRTDDSPARRAAHARHVVDVLAAALEDSTSPWARLTQEVRAHAESSTESYLMHEYLGAHHHTQTLSQFALDTHAASLRYLADSSFAQMLPHLLPAEIRDRIAQHATGVVPTEQLLDVLRGHSFRTSLVVRDDAQVERDLGRFDPSGFYVASRVVEVASADRPGHVTWHAHDNQDGPPLWSTDAPWIRALVDRARSAWPRPVPFELLADVALDALSETELGPLSDDARALWRPRIGQLVLHAHVVGVVDLHRSPHALLCQPGDTPVAWSWARAELGRGNNVTTLRHDAVSLSALDGWVLSRSDGTRTRAQILAELNDIISRRAAATQPQHLCTSGALDEVFDRLGYLSLMVQA